MYKQGTRTALMVLGLVNTDQLKLAYDLNDALRVGRAAKKYIAKPAELKALGLESATNSFGKTKVQAPNALPTLQKIVPGDPKYPSRRATQAGVDKLEPAQHIMLNSIMRGHELDELKVKENRVFRQPYLTGINHMSPDVILREHNRVTTMPEGFEPVRKTLNHMRADFLQRGNPVKGEASQLAPYGVEYGKSPRLSRHARRRISERMEADELLAIQRERDMIEAELAKIYAR